jgi:bifunctional polynucleotide phosphatase/kinase
VYRDPSFRPDAPCALLDLDQTLIRPREGRPFPKDATDWEWMNDNVVAVLRTWRHRGMNLILVTNQSKAWKTTLIESVCQAIGVPISHIVAFQKADHKPSTRLFKSVFPETPISGSFFVGDAVGRAKDHSDCDLLFAKALGVPCLLPEDVFGPPKKRAVYTKKNK